ncbi:hypothetical protein [Sorangium sp. So ce590]|uniref:hypothetical protein n=1 Tax=unclassified Sorangium TaxID=2621164 RepID=UPI003F62CAB5
MEAWSIQKYEQPYLDVRAIRLDAGSGELIVEAANGEYVIEREGGADEETAGRLESLRSPGAALWQEVRGEGGARAWAELLQQMDYLGLLRDASKGAHAADVPERERRALDGAIARAAAWVLARTPDAAVAALREGVGRMLGHAEGLLLDLTRTSFPDLAPLAPPGEAAPLAAVLALDNFYLQVAMIQAMYERRSAPASLVASYLLLLDVAGRLGLPGREGGRAFARRVQEELSGGVYASRDTRVHVDCLATFLVRSTGGDAGRFCRAAFRPDGRKSGLVFMVDVERVVAEASSRIGTPRFLAAVSEPGAPRALAQGCYLQEYHVTLRFVEILTPMMAKRLAPPLRRRMFKYYAEEVGHEAFEYQSCRSLGLTHEQIVDSEPLPLHVAYVDAFTHLAEVDAVGYFVSLFITEGLLGVAPPLDSPLRRLTGEGERFDDGAGRHAALNEEYNHTSLSRLFMADVASVSEGAQSAAIDFMLLLLELNYRAWDDLLDQYGASDPWRSRAPTAEELPG